MVVVVADCAAAATAADNDNNNDMVTPALTSFFLSVFLSVFFYYKRHGSTNPSHFPVLSAKCARQPLSGDRAVMQPFLEAKFTPGMVDGGERGSSKGLGPLLDELLAYVKEVRVPRLLLPCLLCRACVLCVCWVLYAFLCCASCAC